MAELHVIVLPGGGYHRHAPHEGEPVAEWLRGLGHDASVFAYPVLTPHPGPLDAVRAEVRRVRSAGAARVALLGFSAGGHAAGMAAYAPGASPEERVDAVVLGYAVVSMMLAKHKGSRVNLLGERATWDARRETSLDQLVTADAPPTFVWHTAEDAVVPVQHSYLLGMSLAAAGVPHEVHVLPGAKHGVGLATGTPAAAWTDACAAWLRRLGAAAVPSVD
ncbi:prolyl oligopeptidase family serine peptidase [Protaetiibacter sp. SSC-01]|uniref:alpha/beta hydrolase n=1 Tax=Protaetiibacter sp. SSC-01 TaxID=2759943 RepID=UPI0016570919|nr:prolyl oligopeptidase family serine peptidase [Protaetiibacter sp. SSC-01]QNO37400.1 prolyl oligopeptidase family serine peptidase [Protaetiibacter sp. SSC-01]